MKGIDKWSLSSGVFFICIGLILVPYSINFDFLIFYSLICLTLGIIILCTLKSQEHIEPIRKEIKNRKGIKEYDY